MARKSAITVTARNAIRASIAMVVTVTINSSAMMTSIDEASATIEGLNLNSQIKG